MYCSVRLASDERGSHFVAHDSYESRALLILGEVANTRTCVFIVSPRRAQHGARRVARTAGERAVAAAGASGTRGAPRDVPAAEARAAAAASAGGDGTCAGRRARTCGRTRGGSRAPASSAAPRTASRIGSTRSTACRLVSASYPRNDSRPQRYMCEAFFR